MKLRHIGLVVENLTMMEDFYKRIFKVKEVEKQVLEGQLIDLVFGLRRCKMEIAKIPIGDIKLELIKYNRPKVGNPETRRHLAFTSDNIEEDFKKLKEFGFRFFSVPREHDKVKLCFGQDPEGNYVEIVEEMIKEAPRKVKNA